MPRVIGMDEAGLGPNLGPFVVAATVWDVPESPLKFDFWKTFKKVLTNAPQPEEKRLHIADSKEVFQPKRGFIELERGVLAALRLLGHQPTSFDELIHCLTSETTEEASESPPWYTDTHLPLPTELHDQVMPDAWQKCCDKTGVRLVAIRAAVIEPQRFNHYVREYDNKSLLVSRVAFRLLRSVWDPHETETFVVGDKHGGRNRYDDLLAEVLEDEMIFRIEEGAERSDYRVGKTLLRFQPRAEVHGPVALASMTAKYVRELAMTRFNQYWARHIPGLKPTQGYPNDAHRFRGEIAEMQRMLEITDDVLWRSR